MSFVVDETMGTVERAGDDHTSEMESGDEEEVVGGGELTQQLLKGQVIINYVGQHVWCK